MKRKIIIPIIIIVSIIIGIIVGYFYYSKNANNNNNEAKEDIKTIVDGSYSCYVSYNKDGNYTSNYYYTFDVKDNNVSNIMYNLNMFFTDKNYYLLMVNKKTYNDLNLIYYNDDELVIIYGKSEESNITYNEFLTKYNMEANNCIKKDNNNVLSKVKNYRCVKDSNIMYITVGTDDVITGMSKGIITKYTDNDTYLKDKESCINTFIASYNFNDVDLYIEKLTYQNGNKETYSSMQSNELVGYTCLLN